MWDEKDTFARWLQGLFSIFLAAFAFGLGFLIDKGFGSANGYGTAAESATILGALYLAGRCAWYAVTGKDNINRDDLNSGNFE
jgi:hypothetical protein